MGQLPQPTFDRVIIQPYMDPEVTKGGIHIPDSVRKKATMGEVIAVGLGKRAENIRGIEHEAPLTVEENTRIQTMDIRIPMSLQVGDIVYYAEYTGHAIKVDEKNYLVMPEEDVLAFERKSDG